MVSRICAALFAAFLVACAPPSPTMQTIRDKREIRAHRITQIEPIRTAVRCVQTEFPEPYESLSLTIDVDIHGQAILASARSITTDPQSGTDRTRTVPAYCVALAAAVVRNLRYIPFQRDGNAIPVRLTETAPVYPPEIRLARRVPFPDVRNPNAVRIRLERGACFGRCPVYEVEIRGDGTTIYHGRGFVLVDGEHRYTIDRARVVRLIAEFREADFFSLLDRYEYDITDHPANVVSIEIAGRKKSVVDYVGLSAGMPTSVRRLEESIDRAADVERWVKGNPGTVPDLAREGFDFRSPDGAQLMRVAARVAPDRTILDLLDAGTPIVEAPETATGYGWGAGEPVAETARRGRTAVVRAFLARGHFDRMSPTQRSGLLRAAAISGNADLVAEILGALEAYPGGVTASDSSQALASAAAPLQHYLRGQEDLDYRPDFAKVIRLLCQAGGALPDNLENDPFLLSPGQETDIHDAVIARELSACSSASRSSH